MLTLPIRESMAATSRAAIIHLDLQGHPFPYRAGQAVYLQPAKAQKRRPYSIASAPEQTASSGQLEFLVQIDTGNGWGMTPESIKPGELVAVEEPKGSFTFPEHPRERHYVFIAGGTGIAPLRSMLWHALLTGRDGDIALIYSARTTDDFAYLDEFERLAADGRIAFHRTATRSAVEGWTGRQGRIDAAFLKTVIVPGDTLCFLCGPPALVGEMPGVLKTLGVKDEQILMEQWG